MILLLAGMIGAVGFIGMMTRRSLVGVIVGIQVLILGATLMFVLGGILSGSRVEGHLAGVLIVLSGVAQLAAGYALAIRLYSAKESVRMEDLRSLKR